MDFSLKNYRLLGNMNEKVATKIREQEVYPVVNIMDIVDTCAIRFTVKVRPRTSKSSCG